MKNTASVVLLAALAAVQAQAIPTAERRAEARREATRELSGVPGSPRAEALASVKRLGRRTSRAGLSRTRSVAPAFSV